MASAVGLAASVIGIIQLAATATSLSYGYFSSVKDAPESAKKFMDELAALNRVLSTLEGCAQANPESEVLKELEEPVRKCVEEMQDISKKLDPANQRWLKKKLARYKWPLKESQTSAYIKRLERHKSFFIIVLNSDALTRTKAIGTNVEEMMADVKDLKISIVDLNTRAAQNSVHLKRKEILEWLSPIIFDTKHNEISSRRQKDTGDWLLRRPEFQDWVKKNPNSPLLWGYGIPGAGKTFLRYPFDFKRDDHPCRTEWSYSFILFLTDAVRLVLVDSFRASNKSRTASRAIDYLLSKITGSSYGVAYIYFDYRERDQQKPVHVLASLIKQLLCQIPGLGLPTEIKDLYERFNLEHRRPILQDLYNILLVVIRSFTQTFIICDALDECDQKTQRRELLPLFHRMGQAGMNLFLTSREYPEDIQDSLQNSGKIKLQAQEEDITSYIEHKINENPRAKRLVSLGNCKGKIIADLTECAMGMFLLVHFHIEYLCQQTTVREILTELEVLKSASSEENPLGPTYDRAMETLRVQPKNCVGLAYKILTWLVRARRVLTVRELQLAVSVEKDQTILDDFDLADRKTLLEVCASLVTIDEQSDTIRLAHYTVQEYLTKNSIIPPDADLKVAIACTAFLSLDTFAQGACTSRSSFEARSGLYPFLEYAALQLSSHLRLCDEALTEESVLRFLRRPGCITSYLQAFYGPVVPRGSSWNYSNWDGYPKGQTPLHVAASIGHYSAVRLLLKGADIMALDDRKKTALYVAAVNGHRPVVQLLFDNGTKSSTQDMNEMMLKASGFGHDSVVELLLEKGADITATYKTDYETLNALHSAASNGRESVVRLLLEKGADLEGTGCYGCYKRTTLAAAAMRGHKGVVKLLLENGADPLVTNQYGECALSVAVDGGHHSVVRLLLENGADITKYNGEIGYLRRAVIFGRFSVIKVLVEKGADFSNNERCLEQGATILHYAAIGMPSFDSEPIVRFLLESGADMMATDTNNEATVLHWAAQGGQESVVRLLFEKGAGEFLNVRDNSGSTILHYAADVSTSHGKPMIELFLEKGVDPSIVNNDGMTALDLAKSRGIHDTIDLLEMATHGHAACE